MKATIKPSRLKGKIDAPASKSSMQRALAAALVCGGHSTINGCGHSADDKSAIAIIKALGASVDEKDGVLQIKPGTEGLAAAINCGESGLSIRMFTPIVALHKEQVIVNGEGSLLDRPMHLFDEILPQLSVKIISKEGKLPLIIQGPLIPRNIEIDGSLSSQFLTGMLMAYSAAGAKDVSIKVKDLKSKPYIDLTLDIIRAFSLADIENRNYEEFYFRGALLPKDHYEYTVEVDWSSGAFLLVAGAIAGPITVRGLDLNSSQADKAIMNALMSANAGVAVEAKGIKIHPSAMASFEFDATDCPDLFPPLVALAAYCKGVNRIKGCERLKHKESDRSTSLKEEFGKMGIEIHEEGDWLYVHGGEVKGAKLNSHNDHRIAMACAVAALKAQDGTTIEGAEAVKKSYPDFFRDLEKLGAAVSLDNKFKWHE